MFPYRKQRSAHTACPLSAGYIFYAFFYIVAVQTRRFYRHLGKAFSRYLCRLSRRTGRTLRTVFFEPFLLLFRAVRTKEKRMSLLLSALVRLTVLLSSLLILTAAVRFRVQNTLAYAVTYLDRVIAYVSDSQTVTEGSARANKIMQFYSMQETPTLSRAVVSRAAISDATDVSDAIVACHSDRLAAASGLFIDGEYMGAVGDRTELDALLEELRTAQEDGSETKPSVFVQKVTVTDGAYPNETLLSAAGMREKLSSSRSAPVYYTVKSGDNLTAIARNCQLTLSALLAQNPGFSASGILHIGDKLLIKQSSALLQVRTYRQLTYTEIIPFKTQVRENDNHYVGEKYISRKGVNGSQEVVAEVEYTDGVETARTVLKTTVLQKPVTQRMQVGTKKGGPSGTYIAGDGKVTGKFTWPLPNFHTITSYFGPRWGTVHQGLDISGYNVYGKPIVAADGGVVYAVNRTDKWGTGMFAGYGYAVIINHGGQLKTLYAHCSKVVVKAGQKVSRGQVIAYVGNTGYSTGAHLHFEVRKNNTRVNPLPYLR